MSRILRVIRAEDWWLYHLLPLLAAAYASMAHFGVAPGLAYPALGRLLLSIVFIAAFSHIVNDIGDAELDAAAGKPDRWGRVPLWARGGVALGFLAAGFGVWAGAGLSRTMMGLLAGIALLQPIYALPPTRLKERGMWGLVADSLHTHAIPTLFCAALFAELGGASPWSAFPLALTAWSFLVGMRGIIYHQRMDEANDRRAGVTTYVTTHGSEHAGALVRKGFFPAELIALGAVGATLLGTAPVVVLAFLAYATVMQGLRLAGVWAGSFADPASSDPARYIPLLAFYRSWPAPAFALLLAVRDARFIPLFVVHTLVFAGPIYRQGWHLLQMLRLFVVAGSRRMGRRFS